MSQEQLANVTNTNAPNTTTASNNLLSDIIQASGIMPGPGSEIDGDNDKNSVDIPLQEDVLDSPALDNSPNANSDHIFTSSKSECNNIALIETNDNETSSSQKHLECSSDTGLETNIGR